MDPHTPPRAVETPLPQPLADPPCQDAILGYTTTDDGGWGYTPLPVSRTDFAMAFATYGFNRFRVMTLRRGWHLRRKHRLL